MRRGRSWWTIGLAAPLVLFAADTLYWWVAARNLEHGYAAWEDIVRGAGWSTRQGAPVLGGWPLAATLELPQLAFARGRIDDPDGVVWSAERVVLRVELAWPRQLYVTVDGRQQLHMPGIAPVSYTADLFRLELPLHAGAWPDFVDLMAENLRVDIPNAGSANAQSLHLRTDSTFTAKSGEAALAFALDGDDVRLPAVLARPLGPRIARLQAEGALSGPVPAGRTPAEQAAAWRDGGGSLEIRRFAVAWGPLDLSGTATLALDDQLQPMGAGSARLVGYAETLDALAAHGLISRSAATATKAVLSLLAHAPEDGAPPDVEVPLTLQYRTLSMRQVPLLRLPELDWP